MSNAVVKRTVKFPSTREEVFRAWTTPQFLMQWWRTDGYSASAATLDVRTGGHYRIEMSSRDGSRATVRGTYLEVLPPERLVMTWISEGGTYDDASESVLTIELYDLGGATELQLTHERLPRALWDGFDAGWRAVLTRLGEALAANSGKRSGDGPT